MKEYVAGSDLSISLSLSLYLSISLSLYLSVSFYLTLFFRPQASGVSLKGIPDKKFLAEAHWDTEVQETNFGMGDLSARTLRHLQAQHTIPGPKKQSFGRTNEVSAGDRR